MKNLKKSAYLWSSLIVIFIFIIVYLFKGIFPFGSNTVIMGDLGQSYIPVFYNIHDILHGDASLFWSFNLGLGTNFYGSFMLNALLNPSVLLFGLVPRNSIVNFINIYLIIKVVLLTISSTFAIKKIYKDLPEPMVILFSILYALSGYVIFSYHNIVWLDPLFVFPLFIAACHHLIYKRNAKYFVITLSMLLILSYYISFMILLMIVFVGFLAILFLVPKGEKAKVTMKAFLGVLISLGICMFAFLPSYLQASSSLRIASNVTSVSNNVMVNDYFMTKMLFYYGTSIILVLSMINLLDLFRKDRKFFKFYLFSIIFTTIGVFLEPINKMWHTGSYNYFPYRYGFIPLFILLMCSMNYVNRNGLKVLNDVKRKKIYWFIGLVFILIIFLSIKFASLIMRQEVFVILDNSEVFVKLSIIFLLYCLLIFMVLLIDKPRIKTLLIIFVTISQIITNVYYFVGMDNKYIQHAEHKDEIVILENKLSKDFKFTNYVDRYKDVTALLDDNGAYIMKGPSIASWVHILKKEQVYQHLSLGYSIWYTRTQNEGGTLFSDALYHVKYIISREELNDTIYKKVGESNGLSLYEKDTISFGIVNDNTSLGEFDINKDYSFDYQNKLYNILFNTNNKLIEDVDKKDDINSDDNIIISNIKLKELSELYLFTRIDEYIKQIKVNGKVIHVPMENDPYNTVYPNYQNIGIVTLGTYTGDVTVEIDVNDKAYADSQFIEIRKIALQKYKDFILNNQDDIDVDIKNNKMTFKLNTEDEGKYLMIPETFDDGWKATVNGKEVPISKYLTNFMNVPLDKGDNIVELSFVPVKLVTGIIISIISLLVFIIVTLLNYKYHIDRFKIVNYLFTIVALIFYIVFFIFIYIKPFL